MTLIGQVLEWAMSIAMWILVARAIMSWLPLLFPTFRASGPLGEVFKLICAVTDPPTRWMQRFIRPVRLGVASLDLSLMVWFVVLLLGQRIVGWVFF